ncbi:MAG: ArsR family transcriptional regulator [Thermoplasmata archaeon]|nr:ArsR family transcriptional regulator [Thermoplasmata archaeon]
MSEEKTEENLERLLTMLENPVRRRLLKKLAISPNYPLQLAKELGISQQAVMKHLKSMEEEGIVKSYIAPSDSGGPPRRLYVLEGKHTIIMDVGPNLYDERYLSYDVSIENLDLPKEIKGALKEVEKEVEEARKRGEGERERALTELMRKVEREITDVEEYRRGLMVLKDRISEALKETIQEKIPLKEWQERDLLYYLLWEGVEDFKSLSEFLDMREEALRLLLKSVFEDILPREMFEDL